MREIERDILAELLNCPTGAINFGLLIASCDCNITTSISSVGHSIIVGRSLLR